MIVECVTKRIDQFSELEINNVNAHVSSCELLIEVGRRYVVYGVIFRGAFPWYLICEDESSEYPVLYFAGFFNIVDNRVPASWIFQWRSGPWPGGAFIPVEWCEPRFFESLYDGNREAIKIFKLKRKGIEAET